MLYLLKGDDKHSKGQRHIVSVGTLKFYKSSNITIATATTIKTIVTIELTTFTNPSYPIRHVLARDPSHPC